MRLYENAYPSTYEEIKTWHPVWYREILDMDAIWRVLGKKLDEIQGGIIQSVDNNFIDSADAQTISKLEEFLDVSYDGPRILSERRSVIKSHIIGNGHIGQKEIKELIAVFVYGEIKVSFISGLIQITISRANYFNLSDCYFALRSRIPAHLELKMFDNIDIIASGNARISSAPITTVTHLVTNDFNASYEASGTAIGGATLVEIKTELITNDFNTNYAAEGQIYGGANAAAVTEIMVSNDFKAVITAEGSALNGSTTVIVTEYEF